MSKALARTLPAAATKSMTSVSSLSKLKLPAIGSRAHKEAHLSRSRVNAFCKI